MVSFVLLVGPRPVLVFFSRSTFAEVPVALSVGARSALGFCPFSARGAIDWLNPGAIFGSPAQNLEEMCEFIVVRGVKTAFLFHQATA